MEQFVFVSIAVILGTVEFAVRVFLVTAAIRFLMKAYANDRRKIFG
jgi:hypothetical protein